jgi:hypothetical protein
MDIRNLTKEEKVKLYQILTKLTSANMSNDNGYDSTKVGFFRGDSESKPFSMGYQELPELPNGLNNSIKLMYEIIGNADTEIYLGEWTILSLNKSLDNYKMYTENGQKKVFDIAFRYIVLGRIELLSCDLTTHKLFYQADGGANGYERQRNLNRRLKMNPSLGNQIYFTEWFNYINTSL